jgi:hypothetical protein
METGGVASADEPAVPSSPPATTASSLPPPPSGNPDPRSRRWMTVTGGVLIVALIGALLFLYRQAAGDKNDAEDALALTQTELEDVSGLLAASEAAADALEDQLSESDDQLSERTADLDAANQAVQRFLVATFTLGLGVDEVEGACMAEALLNSRGPAIVGIILDLNSAPLGGISAELAAFSLDVVRAQDECGVSLATAPGFSYGDNPVLDEMQDRCQAGDGAGCDELYFASTMDTDYEMFGATCGGRFEPDLVPPFCVGNI